MEIKLGAEKLVYTIYRIIQANILRKLSNSIFKDKSIQKPVQRG